MSLLNDDELNALLEQIKRKSPEPSWELAERTLRAYQASVVRPITWQGYFLQPISIPWPIGVLAAIFLVLMGVLLDHGFRRPSAFEVSRTSHALSSQSTVILNFKEFQPVNEIRPHVMRSVRDEQ